tara:strand:- start:371 stop:871 length:501 start_codon:yes stop_codon:yes gene_type:complete
MKLFPSSASRFLSMKLVFVCALYFSLVAISNILDFGTNFEFVKHVLSMDTLFSGEVLTSRAITNPLWHQILYIMIIIWESIAALGLWYAGFQLFKSRNQNAAVYKRAKNIALYALSIGLLLWFFVFITVGGEYFLMWRSEDWNGIDAAFRMFSIMGIVALLVQNTE